MRGPLTRVQWATHWPQVGGRTHWFVVLSCGHTQVRRRWGARSSRVRRYVRCSQCAESPEAVGFERDVLWVLGTASRIARRGEELVELDPMSSEGRLLMTHSVELTEHALERLSTWVEQQRRGHGTNSA